MSSLEQLLGVRSIMANPMSYGPYKKAFEQNVALIPGGSILATAEISVIGPEFLTELDFQLSPMDSKPIQPGLLPGKSACISHTRDIGIACKTMLNRKATVNDFLYNVPSEKIRAIRFEVFYAPTRHHPLHVRLVPDQYDDEGDIPQSYRESLAELLQSHAVTRN